MGLKAEVERETQRSLWTGPGKVLSGNAWTLPGGSVGRRLSVISVPASACSVLSLGRESRLALNAYPTESGSLIQGLVSASVLMRRSPRSRGIFHATSPTVPRVMHPPKMTLLARPSS